MQTFPERQLPDGCGLSVFPRSRRYSSQRNAVSQREGFEAWKRGREKQWSAKQMLDKERKKSNGSSGFVWQEVHGIDKLIVAAMLSSNDLSACAARCVPGVPSGGVIEWLWKYSVSL